MKNLLIVLAAIFVPTQAMGLTCDANPRSQRFCERVDLAIECIEANYDCGQASYLGTTFSRALFHLGTVEEAARQFHRRGELEGEVRIKLNELVAHLDTWWARSHDQNWLLAVEEANRIVRELETRLTTLLDE